MIHQSCFESLIEGQLVEMQLKRDVKSNLWTQSREQCIGKDTVSLEINRYLEYVKLRLFEIHRKIEEDGKLINPMKITEIPRIG